MYITGSHYTGNDLVNFSRGYYFIFIICGFKTLKITFNNFWQPFDRITFFGSASHNHTCPELSEGGEFDPHPGQIAYIKCNYNGQFKRIQEISACDFVVVRKLMY